MKAGDELAVAERAKAALAAIDALGAALLRAHETPASCIEARKVLLSAPAVSFSLGYAQRVADEAVERRAGIRKKESPDA